MKGSTHHGSQESSTSPSPSCQPPWGCTTCEVGRLLRGAELQPARCHGLRAHSCGHPGLGVILGRLPGHQSDVHVGPAAQGRVTAHALTCEQHSPARTRAPQGGGSAAQSKTTALSSGAALAQTHSSLCLCNTPGVAAALLSDPAPLCYCSSAWAPAEKKLTSACPALSTTPHSSKFHTHTLIRI